MDKKYVVRLTDEEREILRGVVKKLKGSSQKVKRAGILLKADVAGPGWTDRRIAEAFSCRTQTVEGIYARPYDPAFPVLCMDEQPVQFVEGNPRLDSRHEETRPSHRVRASWHREHFPVHRTTQRLASGPRSRTTHEGGLGHRAGGTLRTRYATAEKVILVCDNLNTHDGCVLRTPSPPIKPAHSCVGWSSATPPNTAVG